MMLLHTVLVASGLPAVLAGAPALFKRAPTGDFNLYAYGEDMGGLPLFYSKGLAYVGHVASANDSDAAAVSFVYGTDTSLTGSPNATATSHTWSNVSLVVPSASSTSDAVVFANSNTTSDGETTDYTFYGAFLMRRDSSGSMVSSWYAAPADVDGVWSLNWDSDDSETDGAVEIALKTTKPSTGSSDD
ncbi:hypothetical protein GGR56DRAFT_162806 [Xylariaceae sp. FL0804]|nr:hypothetical protein GGR56DRAFT_162806 [Xylariaceae sp. FL0804]